MPKSIAAVLFDMDGVLVDAREWHYGALNEALAAHGLPVISSEDHRSRFDGLPTSKKLQLLVQGRVIPAHVTDSVCQLKQDLTQRMIETRCQPDPRLLSILLRLKADGYRLAVCSNSVRASVAVILTKLGIVEAFDFYLSNEDVTHPKPHPEIYQEALSRLGLGPSQALVLEDNINGITAARAAKIAVLKVASPKDIVLTSIQRAIQRAEGHNDTPEYRHSYGR